MQEQKSYKNVGSEKHSISRALPQFNQLSDFLTVNETAEYLRVENVTIYRLIKQKRLIAIKLLGKKLLIPKESILTLLRNSEVRRQAAA